MNARRTLLGVAGWPVGHSRSPAMHNAALRELDLDWLYVPLPLPPERFEEAVRALAGSGFAGVNVTLPHKEAALALADERSTAAQAIGAANTLAFADGSIAAENTDAGGFLDALGSCEPTGLKALVLGAGGSARAIAWALREAGAGEVSIHNRTPERARDLADDLDVRHAACPEPADLVVNCTTLGLNGEDASEELGLVEPPATLVDLVYGDRPTALERWARAAGARTVSGVEVLVAQGARSLEGWTGLTAPREVMRAAALE